MGKGTREYTTDEETRVCERWKRGVRDVNVDKMQLFYSILLRHIYTHNPSYPQETVKNCFSLREQINANITISTNQQQKKGNMNFLNICKVLASVQYFLAVLQQDAECKLVPDMLCFSADPEPPCGQGGEKNPFKDQYDIYVLVLDCRTKVHGKYSMLQQDHRQFSLILVATSVFADCPSLSNQIPLFDTVLSRRPDLLYNINVTSCYPCQQ